MADTIVGVMGPGEGADPAAEEAAYQLGRLIAAEGWVLLTGGRNVGVMDAASKGAKQAGGLTLGVLPGAARSEMSEYVDLPVVTGMGSARNNINVLSSDLVFACGVGLGTMSEVLLAAKAGKNVILLNQSDASVSFLGQFESDRFHFASTPADALEQARQLLE